MLYEVITGKYDLLLPAGDFDIVVLHKQQAITRQELTLLDDAADESYNFV